MYRMKRANWQKRLLVGLFVFLVTLAVGSQNKQTDATTVNNGDGEGLGGTGIDGGEGIGGTGIIGVISDVDDFTVNGQRIEIDEKTSVEIDGKIGSQSDLRRGQMVIIEAKGPPSSLRAEIIFVRHEIVGPVTKSIGVCRRPHLRARSARECSAFDLQGSTYPRVGDWVAVSGFRISNGEIHGTRIERRDPQRNVQLYGRYNVEQGRQGPSLFASQI